MKANVGGVDRAVRLVAGLALIAWVFVGGLVSPWNYVAGIAGGVLVLTALMRFCPLYPLLGINTCKKG